MNHEILLYGIAQKEQLGFDSMPPRIECRDPCPIPQPFATQSAHPRFRLECAEAVEECKYRMSRYGVTPNLLVLPPQMLLYMALAPEEKLTYKVWPQLSP